MDEILEKALAWSSEFDHKPWNQVVPIEDMTEIKDAIDRGSNIIFLIGSEGSGKDAIKNLLLEEDGFGLYEEEEMAKEHNSITAERVKQYLKDNGSWNDDDYLWYYNFRNNSAYKYKEIRKESLVYAFINKKLIIQFPDSITEQKEFNKHMKLFSILYDDLRALEETYYNDTGKPPHYKLIFFLSQEYTGTRVEKIKHIQLTQKSTHIFLKPYSIKKLLQIYGVNINQKYQPFSEGALKELAELTLGNPRNFKKLIHEQLSLIKNGVKTITVNDLYMTQYIEELKEIQEMTELEELYEGTLHSNARITQYYPRIKRIIKENPNVNFKSQTQITQYAIKNYGKDYLNSRKVSNVLKPINESNNLNNGEIKYKTLIYRDYNSIYKYDSEKKERRY